MFIFFVQYERCLPQNDRVDEDEDFYQEPENHSDGIVHSKRPQYGLQQRWLIHGLAARLQLLGEASAVSAVARIRRFLQKGNPTLWVYEESI